jgi:DNA-binding LacI/PurR family transcriptional regulator
MKIKATRQPKYKKIAEQLRQEIHAGRLSTQDRLPSFTELHARFGATPTTANQVFGVLEKQGLIVREPGRGVFVAKPTLRPATGVVGVMGRSLAENDDVPYWAYLLQGMRRVAEREGVELLLLNSARPGPGWEKIDGVLVSGAPEKVQAMLPPGMPGVSLIQPTTAMSSVVANDYAGAKLATAHLLELGHRRIGYMQPPASHRIESRRLTGYQAALWDAGIESDPRWVHRLNDGWKKVRYFDDLGRVQMSQWLQGGWAELGLTAMLTHNDEMAIGVIETLQNNGIEVPRDVSVVGFDGTKAGEYFRPRLTSIEVPLQRIGERSLELLLEQIKEEKTELVGEVMPVRLVVRESTQAI